MANENDPFSAHTKISGATENPVTLQSAAVANGDGTAISVFQKIGARIQVFGITTAVVNWEATVDGTNWVSVRAMNVANGTLATSTSADGIFYIPIAGYNQFRARISGYAAGTITVSGRVIGHNSGEFHDIDVVMGALVPGTGATDLGKAEDAGHTSGDVGVQMLGVRKDIASALAGTDGDYQPPIFDSTGRMHVNNSAATPAGENHIGEVHGAATLIDITPTVSSSPAYTAGDAVGGKQTLSNALRVSGGTAVLESLTLIDAGNQKAALEVIIFDADPSAATITDNAAFVWSTDLTKVLARIAIAATDYTTVAGGAIAQLKGLNVVLKPASGTTLYAAVVASGTPTYTSISDLKFRYGILQN